MKDKSLVMNCLENYHAFWLGEKGAYPGRDRDDERRQFERIAELVTQVDNPFAARSMPGHVTGSALVVSHDGEQVLLTLHGKLGKWLQLGGHSDDDPRTTAVALREGHEESGMTGLTLWRWEHAFGLPIEGTEALALDLDVHDIPARGEMPQHAHHDIRFVVRAPKDAMPQISAESKDLRWFSLKEARALTQERSMTRQFDKWEWLRKKF